MTISEPARALMDARFGRDTLLSLATVDQAGEPHVRIVDSYYEDGAFYVVTYALSNKMQQIAKHPQVGVCGEWFTGQGVGENLGWVCAEENRDLIAKLRTVFSAWYYEGDVNESDPNTCILRVRLLRGLLQDHGARYELV